MPGQADGGSEGETFKGLRDADVLDAIFKGGACPICGWAEVGRSEKTHLEEAHHLITTGTLEAKKELIAFERNQQSLKMGAAFVIAASLAAWVIVNVVAHGKVSIVLGG